MKDVSFYGNLKEPEIRDLKVEKISAGEYSVSAEIVDDSTIEVYLETRWDAIAFN